MLGGRAAWEWVRAVIRVADPLVVVIGRFSEGVVGSGDRAVESLSVGVAWMHVSDVRAVISEVKTVVALG